MNSDSRITIQLNQTPTTLNRPTTLAQMLDELSISTQGVAVARNQIVVPQTQWDSTLVNDQDTIQLFQAIAGG